MLMEEATGILHEPPIGRKIIQTGHLKALLYFVLDAMAGEKSIQWNATVRILFESHTMIIPI